MNLITTSTKWPLDVLSHDIVENYLRTNDHLTMEAGKIHWEEANFPKIKKVIFNYPATIIIWSDKTKTVVKCKAGDMWDPEKGFVMAYLTKVMGKSELHKSLKKYVRPQEELEEQYYRISTPDFLKNPKKYLEEATKAFNKIMLGLEDK